ncbi:MAG: GNAT family N-acetyltransferase [Actinobacteria bacterium]|nr:GNAT family N-acetyltransferase [Actinomycetota bacterium]
MSEERQRDEVLQQAMADAERAAELTGAVIREMSGAAEEAQVIDLLDHIWGRSKENSVLPKEFLRVLGKTGNYIAGAFVDGELIGASLGLHSSPERRTLHSHISGVTSNLVGKSVGYALKLHQRAWALSRGIDTIEWTYDPLISRNANFNIRKLGATPVEYLENFYGPMTDSINAGDSSDRLLVRWHLRDPAVLALLAHDSRVPVPSGSSTVTIPDDIEAMRTSDPEQAKQWRLSVREQLTNLLSAGGQIIGFERGTGYILDQASDKGEK